MRMFALFAFAAALVSSANAADLRTPVNPYTKAPAAVACTVTACTGGFIGGNLMNVGTSLNVIGTGINGIAQNGLGLGGQFGYEYFNSNIYASLYGVADYDASINTIASIKDRFTYGGGVKLGYSLAGFFGGTQPAGTTLTLPQQLANSLMTPYVQIEEVNRHGQAALGTGAGIEALLAADSTGHSSWTLDADLIQYTYNQGGSSGTIVGLPTSQASETVVRVELNRHFNFGF